MRIQKSQLSAQAYDEEVYKVPRHWATNILKKAGVSVEISGVEHLPIGPVLFISNHEGNFDIPVLIAHVPKPFGFLSKVEVKKIPFISDWMEEMNCVFIDRTNRKNALQSIHDSVERLQQGHSLLLFPEGTRSKGNGVQPFKSGFIRIAERANVPIVPIAIYGTSHIMEQNNNHIVPAHVKIQLLPYVELSQQPSEWLLADIQNQIEQAVAQLKGDL
ncbi:lysophospholipid acyltransferase family protein [Chryseomicrobium palamuruense]|uniref:1-acyl-sn-glycerol-3-phosphate acyltransferase n=1 Tax=Chryseomicrobium palamuruense TaxID=682973 RepID=A0ABV8UV80_9BACL